MIFIFEHSSLVNKIYTADNFSHFVAFFPQYFWQVVLNFLFKSCVYMACVLTCMEYACRYMHCADVSKGQRLESFSFISHLTFVEDRVSPCFWSSLIIRTGWSASLWDTSLSGPPAQMFTGGFTGVCYSVQCAYVGSKDLNSALIYRQQTISLLSNPLNAMAPDFL